MNNNLLVNIRNYSCINENKIEPPFNKSHGSIKNCSVKILLNENLIGYLFSTQTVSILIAIFERGNSLLVLIYFYMY